MEKNKICEFTSSIDDLEKVAKFVLNRMKEFNIQFLFLKGDIGTGKTTLVKQIAKKLGETETITSPSFNKMLIYEYMVHIDAYNMEHESIDSFIDYFEDKIVIIEWVENLNDDFNNYLAIDIIYVDENTRKYIIFERR